jgi:hypothetical protein
MLRIESEKVIKKNIMALRMPKFITKESKSNFPIEKKSIIDSNRRTIIEITSNSLIIINGID